MEEFRTQEIKAPFNMALNTLERLGIILIRIRENDAEIDLPPNVRQSIKLNLTKQFFFQASPLLSEEVVSKYEDAFLDLRPVVFGVLRSKGFGIYENINQEKEVFDWYLEQKLDMLLLDIQRELQKEKYFMPPKKDLGRAVGSFS